MQRLGNAVLAAAFLATTASLFAITRKLTVEIVNLRSSLRPVPPPLLEQIGNVLWADGVDQHGQVVDRMPRGARRMVVIPLSGGTMRRDVPFWQDVSRRAPQDTFFLAICSDRVCAAEAPEVSSRIRIIVAGEVAGMIAANRAASVGKFFITDNAARILAVPRVGASGAETVERIETNR